MHRKNRVLLVPFGVVAGLLVVASVAYACTAWIGQFKVTGNGTHVPTASDTVTVDGKGTRTSFVMDQCVDSSVAKSTHTSGSITIWTGESPQVSGCNNDPDAADRRLPECGSGGSPATCTGSNKRTYEVRYYNSQYGTLGNGPGYDDHDTYNVDCMSTLLNGSVQLGSMTVDSNGNIDSATGGTYNSTAKTANFSLPSGSQTHDQSPAESAVCVSDAAAYYGNQAPLTIV